MFFFNFSKKTLQLNCHNCRQIHPFYAVLGQQPWQPKLIGKPLCQHFTYLIQKFSKKKGTSLVERKN